MFNCQSGPLPIIERLRSTMVWDSTCALRGLAARDRMTGKLLRETRRSAESFHQFCSRFGRQQSQDVVCPGRFLVRFVEPFTDQKPAAVGEDVAVVKVLVIPAGDCQSHADRDHVLKM